MSDQGIRLGVVGLSRGFDLTRPTLKADPRVRVVAAADPRPEARAAFAEEFGAFAYADAAELLADPAVEAVYIATPHQTHVDLAVRAARAGRHVLVEKPMALTLADCDAMAAAAREAGVAMVVGPSHGFDAPVAWAADLIASGAYGPPRMVTALNFTDFLYRPRRPEELDTTRGGGVIFSQAVHQIDVVRRLVGARILSVRASAGAWDPARPTEGAYQAFLTFAGGASAALTYSGMGRWDSDALMGWVGELGQAKDPDAYAAARRRLARGDEAVLKQARAYGAETVLQTPAPAGHEHFGFVLVACEGGDLRLTATGVEICAANSRRTVALPVGRASRQGVIDELWRAVHEDQPPLHDAAWGRENLAACLAILRSARENREVSLAELETKP